MAKRTKLSYDEPIWNPKEKDAEWTFFGCVNKYRTMIHPSSKKEKKWVMDYMKWKKYEKEDIENAQRGGSFYFGLVAPACRICTQGDTDAPPQWQKSMNDYILKLITEGKKKKREREENKLVKVFVSIQDRIKNQVGEYLEMLHLETDNFLDNIKDKPNFNIANWLKGKKVKAVQSSMIAEAFEPTLQELNDTYNKVCDQLVEGYDYLTRPQLKRFRDMVEEIIVTCKQHSKLTKAVRKPRRKKSQAPGKIIKKLNYCEKSEEYGVSSIDPRKIIGANKVIVFNTKYKKLAIFEASPLVDGLSVKGTTIVGFDDKKSRERTVRKPHEIVKDCNNSGIRQINNRYNSLKTKEKVPTGRINKYCVILQALK